MTSSRIPHEIFHWYIIPELVLEQLHNVLVGERHASQDWNAFLVIPLVCSAFNLSVQILYRRIFGVEDSSSLYDAIRPIYTHVRDLWTLARNPIEDPDALPETRYRELMANKSLIQALSYRQGANHPSRELLRRKGLELPDLANGEDPCKMKDDKMYRLFLPLTCASKLCDTIRPEDLAYRVADYIADITPWYTILPVLLKYVQDIDTYVAKEYAVSKEVSNDWALQTLKLIDRIDDFMQQFQNVGHLVCSVANFSKVPAELYEVVNLRQVLEQVTRCDEDSSTPEIQTLAEAILLKLNNLSGS